MTTLRSISVMDATSARPRLIGHGLRFVSSDRNLCRRSSAFCWQPQYEVTHSLWQGG